MAAGKKRSTPAAAGKQGRKSAGMKMPPRIRPMSATLEKEAFDDAAWIFETKYDGYRALSALDGKGHVDLYSRNLLSFNLAYPEIVKELETVSHMAILDGEVVAENARGKCSFQLLQNFRREKKGALKYYVFDLLWLDGASLIGLPLLQRKELLHDLLGKARMEHVLFSEHLSGKGKKFFSMAERSHLEGIMAKRAAGLYYPGLRTREWLKIKAHRVQEAVIAGITMPGGSRKHFGSLLLGVYDKGKLVYIGNCGTGFNEKTLQELYARFKPYFLTKSPFIGTLVPAKNVQWVSPRFVCQVKFTEWTKDQSMRHPVFLGLRVDKPAREVHREIPGK